MGTHLDVDEELSGLRTAVTAHLTARSKIADAPQQWRGRTAGRVGRIVEGKAIR
ncbi:MULTISPECIES: hypothetical protein [unclassified Mycobacterium]|uniref:hypothetical protein n=1 Tax=unclassified Mycobacterium TaxID=2642494 RepID=UPI000A6E45F4|nr:MULTISPECIES: hypothetical protein [unclassified Mycobacterium]